LGIDPGFGSSPFGLVITEWVDNQIKIAYAEEFERPDFNQSIKITLSLVTKYGITFDQTTSLPRRSKASAIRRVSILSRAGNNALELVLEEYFCYEYSLYSDDSGK
jgi:hypothetical protein